MIGHNPVVETLKIFDTNKEKPLEFLHTRSFININAATGWAVSSGGKFPYENKIRLPISDDDFPVTLEYQPHAIIQPNAVESCAPSNFPYIETTGINEVTLYAFSIPSPTTMLPIVVNLTQTGSPYGATNASAARSSVEQTAIQLSQNYFVVETQNGLLKKEEVINYVITAYKGGEMVKISKPSDSPANWIFQQDGTPITGTNIVISESLDDYSINVTLTLPQGTRIQNGVAVVYFPINAGGVFYPRATVNTTEASEIIDQVESYEILTGDLSRSTNNTYFVDGIPLSGSGSGFRVTTNKKTINGLVTTAGGELRFLSPNGSVEIHRQSTNGNALVTLTNLEKFNSYNSVIVAFYIGGQELTRKMLLINSAGYSVILQTTSEFILPEVTREVGVSSYYLLEAQSIVRKTGTIRIYQNEISPETLLKEASGVSELSYSLMSGDDFISLEGINRFVITFTDIDNVMKAQRSLPIVGMGDASVIWSLVSTPAVLTVRTDGLYNIDSSSPKTSEFHVYRNGVDVSSDFTFAAELVEPALGFEFKLNEVSGDSIEITSFSSTSSHVGVFLTATNRENSSIKVFGSLQTIRRAAGQETEYYVHIRYTDDPDDPNSPLDSISGLYMGVAVTEIETAPTEKSAYKWTLNGKDGNGVSGTETHYVVSDDGSSIPDVNAGWDTTFPALVKGEYLWTRITISYTEGADSVSYSAAYIAIDGDPGKDGNPGKDGDPGKDAYAIILSNESHTFVGDTEAALAGNTITHVKAYEGVTLSATKIEAITGLPEGMTAVVSNDNSTNTYITFTVTDEMVSKNGTVSISISVDEQVFTKLFTYSLSLRGESGYTWIKYADSPTEGMSDSADGKKYIGMAFNKATDTESDDYEDYQWSLMPQNIITEGRNYVLKSDEVILLESDISEHTYDLSEPYEADVDYTISVEFEPTSVTQSIYLYIDGLSEKIFTLSPTENLTSWTGKTSNGGATSVRIEPLTTTAQINKIWITKSNQQMGWSLAPEDIRSEIDESKRITVEFVTPNGLVYKKGSDTPITIEARVLKGSLDITDNLNIAVKWTRNSTNSILDEVFNLADRSGRLLTLDSNDLGDGATYHCNVYFITTQSLLNVQDKAITVFPPEHWAESGDDTSLDVVVLGDLWLTSDVTVTVDTQDLISREIISVREEISHGKEIIDEVDRIGHTLSSVKAEISTIEIDNGRLGRQVIDVVTAQTNLQNSIIETSEGVKRTVSSISGLKSNLVSVEQTVKDLTVSVKDGGGSNLLLNSVGYAGLNFWQRGSDHLVDPLTTVSSWALQGVAKHGWTFADEEGVAQTGHIYQRLSLTAGQEYTVTGRARKETQEDEFRIDIRSNTGTTIIHEGFNVTGNNQQDHTFTFHFTAPDEIQVELHVYGRGFELTDLGCYKGNAPAIWQQYAGEVYTLNVQVDKRGLRVFSEDKLSETVMSPEEFSGYYNNEKVFTLNGSVTEVQGLSIKKEGLHVAPIKMIRNDTRSSLVIVWAGF